MHMAKIRNQYAKKTVTRNARIGLRITDDQKTAWQEAADQENLTLSKWIVKQVDRAF
jgi:uncharacterized protein (DUF1778 family)